MSHLEKLKNANTRAELAHILGFQSSKLSYILYKLPDSEKYHTFEVPKKNGSTRIIQAPDPRLKTLQRRLADVLYVCSNEINKKESRRPLSHGFKKGYSIYSNAKCHKNRRYVLNFDLEDFFPSINFGRVRGYFIKNRDFELEEQVATTIAKIACHNNELPQGSPCSPVVSNLIAHLLDVRLVRIAKKYKCTYSRYADDITFSTSQKDFPTDIAIQDRQNKTIWCLSELIENQVERSGFKVNSAKTRMSYSDSRQVVTGLIVNKKINVRSEYYKLARAMAHSLFTTGAYSIPSNLSPIDVLERNSSEKEEENEKETQLPQLNRLEGMLNHIHYTRNLSDQREIKEKQDHPTAMWSLFQDFLFFKYFGMPHKPIVLCEGPTDSIYIKLALKKFIDCYPSLIKKEENSIVYCVHFLQYTGNVKDVLQLSGGTDQLANFVGIYQKKAKHYQAWNPSKPVILLTDNDKGAKNVFNAVRDHSKDKPVINISSNDDFFYVNNNLYLVKIPSFEEKTIEDLFDPKWLNYKIGDKKFNRTNKSDDTSYGKSIFAKKVIAKNFAKVDFSEFISLLDRFVKVIYDFSKKRPNSQNTT